MNYKQVKLSVKYVVMISMSLINCVIMEVEMERHIVKERVQKAKRNSTSYLSYTYREYLVVHFFLRVRIYFGLGVVLFLFQKQWLPHLVCVAARRVKRAVWARCADRFAWNKVKPSICVALPQERAFMLLKRGEPSWCRARKSKSVLPVVVLAPYRADTTTFAIVRLNFTWASLFITTVAASGYHVNLCCTLLYGTMKPLCCCLYQRNMICTLEVWSSLLLLLILLPIHFYCIT